MHCGLEGHSMPKLLTYLLRLSDKFSKAEKQEQHYSHEVELAAYFSERASNGTGLIVTGGISPNYEGALAPFGSHLNDSSQVPRHKYITNAVQDKGGRILLQILHAGRYSNHPFSVAPSSIRSPISMFQPRSLSLSEIQSTIQDYVRCAKLAHEAGYNGIELMGSEGYLIHQFICPRTNTRKDKYGGSARNRTRFALDIVREIRLHLPEDFIIMFRLSMLDLVDGASTWEEIVMMARELEASGVTIINTGIGWHESRVPTIATLVPRGAFTWVTAEMKNHVKVPLCATNRINTPEKIESVLKDNMADLVSMARPFLADEAFLRKAFEERPKEINTCIACNQACLDHVFKGQRASCLVNPRACRELELPPIKESNAPSSVSAKTTTPLNISVIGSGPAGLSAALTFSKFGHHVNLHDCSHTLGGQFNMAKVIPGKSEFQETLRYFDVALEREKVNRVLGKKVRGLKDLGEQPPDIIVLATGIIPRMPNIQNIHDNPKIVNYIDVLSKNVDIGQKVAIMGAGGIGVDVAEYLLSQNIQQAQEEASLNQFMAEWNVDHKNWACQQQELGSSNINSRQGGLISQSRNIHNSSKPKRQIILMQRKSSKVGANLGKTTGWIHRAKLNKENVELLSGCEYEAFDKHGNLHLKVEGQSRVLEVDNVVLCAGQLKNDGLYNILKSDLKEIDHKNSNDTKVYVIGGAQKASELDAKRAINMGMRLAYAVEKYGDDENKIRNQYLGNYRMEDEEILIRTLAKLTGKKL